MGQRYVPTAPQLVNIITELGFWEGGNAAEIEIASKVMRINASSDGNAA